MYLYYIMRNFLIGLGICISLYSTFYYLQCKNKKGESKNDKEKEEINNDEEKGEVNNDDKSTQTENLIKNIDGKKDKEIIEEVLDDIITAVEKEKQGKKTTVSFDEDFEVIQ